MWRRAELVLDRETVDGSIAKLMSIDEYCRQLVDELVGGDDGERSDA